MAAVHDPGDYAPHAGEDPPPPEGLSARDYAARVETIWPDVDTATRAIAWACCLVDGPTPLELVGG